MSSRSNQPPRKLRLSAVDHPFAREGCPTITLAYYFPKRLNAESLKASLAPTLDKFFPLKGRLAYEDADTLCIEEDVSSPLGAALFEEIHVEEMPDLQNWRQMIEFMTPVDTLVGSPLARFRLVQLPAGSLLSVSLSHGVADGYGYVFFTGCWAAASRGMPLPNPNHDRSALTVAPHDGMLPEDAARLACAFILPSERLDERNVQLEYEQLSLSSQQVDDMRAQARQAQTHNLSRNDVLTAWLWKKYLTEWNEPGDDVSVTCAVDVRRLVEELTPLYFGNASLGIRTVLSYDELTRASVGELALKISASVEEMDRSAAENTMRGFEGLRRLGWYRPNAPMGMRGWHPDSGLLVTNLTRLPLAQLDFGEGPPEYYYALGGHRTAVILAVADGVRVLVGLGPKELARTRGNAT